MALSVRILVTIGLAAISGVASARDYSGYRVIDSATLDLMAGPVNTAALLSPDGSRLLHIGSNICLLAPAEAGAWKKAGCIKNRPDYEARAPEDALWSPRSGRVVMPTYVAGVLGLNDTDVQVFDPDTMTITNLTDDGYGSTLQKSPTPVNFDLIARWLEDDTILFLRYPIGKEAVGNSGSGWPPPSLMTIAAAGGKPTELLTLPSAGRLHVHTLAVSADGRRIAYGYNDNDNPGVAGIYVLEVGRTAPKRVAAMTHVGKPPEGMAFSADGDFLLLLGPYDPDMGQSARVLDVATGKVVPVDTNRTVAGVAWSPNGSALAYVTDNRTKANEPGGLFLANRPGEPGRRLLSGAFMPPVCCGRLPFTWASNDTLILGNAAKHDAPLFVRLGK
jgi:hypothetical protein